MEQARPAYPGDEVVEIFEADLVWDLGGHRGLPAPAGLAEGVTARFVGGA
jgi:hypothetical protein